MNKLISFLTLIVLLVLPLSYSETKPVHDNFDDNTFSLFSLVIPSDDDGYSDFSFPKVHEFTEFTETDFPKFPKHPYSEHPEHPEHPEHSKYPKYPNYPKYPERPKYPKHPKHPFPKYPHKFPIRRPRRAYALFLSPPDLVAGVIGFYQARNKTLVFGQFSQGFVEGGEKDYSFKVYSGNEAVLDLKPEGDHLDRIFTIKQNGATEPFVYAINGTLVPSIIGGSVVIAKPDGLLGKSQIKIARCR